MTSLAEHLRVRAQAMSLVNDLPELTGLDAATCKALLDGSRQLTAATYQRLCNALVLDAGAFQQGVDDPGMVPVRFRNSGHGTTLSGRDLRTLAMAARVGTILGQVNAEIERPVTRWRKPRAVASRPAPWRQGYDLAERVRARWVGGNEPIADLQSWMQAQGIHVAWVSFDNSSIRAATVAQAKSVPVVLMNSSHQGLQHVGVVRSTLAHDLAHLIADAGDTGYTTQVSLDDKAQGDTPWDRIEKRANGFSPAFIAPPDALRAAFPQMEPGRVSMEMIVAIARRWGLSFHGAVWHTKNVFQLSETSLRELQTSPRPAVDLSAFERSSAGSLRAAHSGPTVTQNQAALLTPSSSEQNDDDAYTIAPVWRGLASDMLVEAEREGEMSSTRVRELLSSG